MVIDCLSRSGSLSSFHLVVYGLLRSFKRNFFDLGAKFIRTMFRTWSCISLLCSIGGGGGGS